MVLFYLLFLPLFSAIYFSGHWIFYKIWQSQLHLIGSNRYFFIIALALMGSGLFITSVTARIDQLQALSQLSGVVSYFWLTVLLYTLLISGVFKIILFFIPDIPFGAYATSIATVLGIIISISGVFRANAITVPHHAIYSSKIKKPVRIMHISDVHFSPVIGSEMARKIQEIYKKYQPDIIISSGDLLDSGISDRKIVTEILDSIRPPMGKYACTGNHEFISGIDYSTKFHEETGFNLLRNSSVTIDNFVIAGVDDPSALRMGDIKSIPSDSELFSGKPDDKFRILIKHQPFIMNEKKPAFNLQLSGHTHNGQLFPFSLFTSLIFKYDYGFYELTNEASVVVSSGTGTWGPYSRVGTAPEIIIIDLLPSPPNAN
ncbi:MAG: metallophosphoesterase [Deltaproteobacteria bacterium]|nr:metallophosphoesterase [Deltaproteobacteria bacterium]